MTYAFGSQPQKPVTAAPPHPQKKKKTAPVLICLVWFRWVTTLWAIEGNTNMLPHPEQGAYAYIYIYIYIWWCKVSVHVIISDTEIFSPYFHRTTGYRIVNVSPVTVHRTEMASSVSPDKDCPPWHQHHPGVHILVSSISTNNTLLNHVPRHTYLWHFHTHMPITGYLFYFILSLCLFYFSLPIFTHLTFTFLYCLYFYFILFSILHFIFIFYFYFILHLHAFFHTGPPK